MGVTTDKIVTLESGAKGKLIGYQIEGGEAGLATAAVDVATMICDYQGCTKGDFTGAAKNRKVFIIDDPNSLPPRIRQILTVVDWESTKFTFCSAGCAIRYLQTDYRPLREPGDPAKIHLVPKATKDANGQHDVSGSKVLSDGVAEDGGSVA